MIHYVKYLELFRGISRDIENARNKASILTIQPTEFDEEDVRTRKVLYGIMSKIDLIDEIVSNLAYNIDRERIRREANFQPRYWVSNENGEFVETDALGLAQYELEADDNKPTEQPEY